MNDLFITIAVFFGAFAIIMNFLLIRQHHKQHKLDSRLKKLIDGKVEGE